MLKKVSEFSNILICPICKKDITKTGGRYICQTDNCEGNVTGYKEHGGIPVLIDFNNSLAVDNNFSNNSGGVLIPRRTGKLKNYLWQLMWGDSPATKNCAKEIINLLHLKKNPKILFVGGGTIGSGMEAIFHNPQFEVISFDIYASNNISFIADAHSIPIESSCIDCVIVQAVLEHVLIPEVVVQEIYRVLNVDGLVYAETPFMQQVHEAAYDFTRYTESGHQWLFRNFSVISSGYVRGVGVALIWSIKYFFTALLRSKAMGTLIAACFFWLRFLEKICSTKDNINGASCFYFLGRKATKSINQKDIVDFYDRTR